MAKPRIHRADRDRSEATGPARKAALQEREALLSSINANLAGTCVYRMHYGATGSMSCTYVSPNVEQLIGVSAEKFLADPARIFALVHEDDRPAFRAALAQSLVSGAPADIVARVRSPAGVERWMQFRSRLVERRADGIQVRDSVVVDITALKKTENINAHQTGFFTTLCQITVELLGRRDQAGLLQSIVNHSAALFDAAQVELDLIEGDALVARGFKGEAVTRLGEAVTRREDPLSWQAIDRGEPVVVENYAAHADARESYRRLGIKAVAILPIMHGSRCLGTLGIARQPSGPGFSPEEITQGLVFSQLAALALHQAGIYEEVRREAELRTGELRASEQQLDRVVRNINAALMVDDSEGRLVYANRRFFELFGLPEQDPRGLVIENYIAPEWRKWLRDQHDRRIRGEAAPENFEFEILRPDGRRLWLDVSTTRVVVDGRITGTQSVIRDFTAHKQSERTMSESAAQLRATLDSTADGILTVGSDGQIQSFNQRFIAMWGMPPEVATARDDNRTLQFVVGLLQSPGQFLEKVRQLYAHPLEESFDTLELKDGRTFERYSRPMLVEGHPVGRVWSFRDITERKQVERALRQAHERTAGLARLGRTLAEADTRRAAALAIIESARQLLDWDCCWLHFWNAEKQAFEEPVNFDLADGERREIASRHADPLRPSPLMTRVMQEGAQLLLRESADEGAEGLLLFGTGRRSLSLMFAPIRRGEHLLGIVSIQSYRPQAYDQAALEFFQTLADHCAGALVRLQSAAALAESEARYQRADRGTNDGLWEWNLVTGGNYRSRRWLEMLGYAPGELAEDIATFMQLIHPDDRELVIATGEQRRADTQPFKVEMRLRRKDGAYLWVQSRGQIVSGAGGKPWLMTGSITDISERKQAEAALRENEERFRAVFEHSPISIGLLSVPDGRLVEINHAGLETFGLTRGDAIGRTTMELGLWVDPTDREHFQAELQTKGHIFGLEARMRRKNGEIFSVLCNGSLIQIAGQSYSLNSLVDITKQRTSEAAVRASEERFRLASLAVFDVIWDQDIPTGKVWQNEHFQRFFGYSPEETEQMVDFWFGCLHPDDRERLRASTQLAQGGGGDVWADNYRFRRKDGSYAFIEDRAHIIRDGTGRPVRLIGAMRDVTKQKTAELALRESEELFHGVFEASPIPILLFTATEGRLTDVNPAALEAFGYLRAEVVGRTTEEMGVWVRAEEHTRFFQRIAVEKTVSGFEAIMRTKAGAERIMLCTGTLLRLAGQPRVLASAVDITAVRRAEAEQAAMRERALVTQKHEALGTLAGGVAHDFNNILTGVLNYTQLAQSDCPPTHPQIREFLGEVLKCGHRAKELVRQILLFSRAEAAERMPLMLQRPVQEALTLLRSTIPTTVTIKADLGQPVTVVLANATQIHQVMMNLGVNAAHAMQEQGGTLTVRLRRRQVDERLVGELPELKPGVHLCLEVADTGKGIAPVDLARIFEPFFTTKKIGEGTGLGLAVVHSIMRTHEGAVRVRSELGRGTTFELFFPLLAVAAPTEPGLLPHNAPRGRGQRILLIDDETVIGQSVQVVLERLGYRVTVFTDPRQALLRWEAAPEAFDAVLTDFQMPGMTGLVLARKIMARRPGLPVLIMSGFAGTNTPQSLRAEGFTDFLAKPMDLDKLAETLARVLPEEGAARPRP